MRTVRDEDGRRYLLLKESEETSLVRDPETGATQYLPNEDLESVPDAAPFATAAAGVPEETIALVTAVHDERVLGLVIDLVDRGPLAVRDVLAATTLCESDLHGALAELAAAGLVEETAVAGERGYHATATAATAVDHLRNDP